MNDSKYDKKFLNNSISYVVNKKMNCYSEKINSLEDKINENLVLSTTIINYLKSENEILKTRLKIMEDKIETFQITFQQTIQQTFQSNDNKNKYITNESNKEEINSNHKSYDLEICNNVSIKKKNKNKIIEHESNNYKSIVKESYEIDDSFIRDCLDMTSLEGDIKIFKKMYIDDISKEYYPIRHIKKKIQYWNGTNMIDDPNGTFIKNTILKNIEECYLKVNNYDDYSNNMDQFLKNQEHINKIMEEKYKNNFLAKIISIISI